MFKTSASILFITLSLLMQYVKQFAYLECKIENIGSKTTCDCEKKNNSEVNKNGQTIPSQKNHLHAFSDDCYVSAESSPDSRAFYQSGKFLSRNVCCNSFYSRRIFHPPQL